VLIVGFSVAIFFVAFWSRLQMAFIRTFKQGKRTYRAVMKSVWNREKKRSEQRIIKWLGRTGESETEETFSSGGDNELES
jgi:hypothetical protein